MPRYIDADKALKSVDDALDWMKDADCDMRAADWIHEVVQTALDASPTEDVEPVKHGKWTGTSFDGGYCASWKCSHCKVITFGYYRRNCEYKYCPWCGAKMEEEDDGRSEDHSEQGHTEA